MKFAIRSTVLMGLSIFQQNPKFQKRHSHWLPSDYCDITGLPDRCYHAIPHYIM